MSKSRSKSWRRGRVEMAGGLNHRNGGVEWEFEASLCHQLALPYPRSQFFKAL